MISSFDPFWSCGGLHVVTAFATAAFGEVHIVTISMATELPMRVFFQFIGFSKWQSVTTGWIDILGAVIVIIGVMLLPCKALVEEYRARKRDNSEMRNGKLEKSPILEKPQKYIQQRL